MAKYLVVRVDGHRDHSQHVNVDVLGFELQAFLEKFALPQPDETFWKEGRKAGREE
jgi:hypothetical protein